MIYIPPGGDGTPRVRPDDLSKADAKRLRRVARGSRGRARGRGAAPAVPIDPPPAEDSR